MVPENPPPTIATGAGRSDFIIRPVLWIGSARFALGHMGVEPFNGPARSLREPSWNNSVNKTGRPGTHHLGSDLSRADAVIPPTHAQDQRVLAKQPKQDSATGQFADLLLSRGHIVPIAV
ncbi:MAG: hypothetical protein M3Q52_05955 [Pseudomonadota bacterium]|nr:hypothetical protein [Pseudomonadota bacterium]